VNVVQQRRPGQEPDPVLITDAARSYEEELRTRRRRYTIMMAMRLPCMVLAAVFYETPWLAVGLLVISIPLPWMAVLIANDRLAPKREHVSRFRTGHRSLEARPHLVVEGAPMVDAGAGVVDGVDGVVDGEVVGEPAPTRPGHSDARRAG
jgi:hypothetical protein